MGDDNTLTLRMGLLVSIALLIGRTDSMLANPRPMTTMRFLACNPLSLSPRKSRANAGCSCVVACPEMPNIAND